jgi:hypothetical protein
VGNYPFLNAKDYGPFIYPSVVDPVISKHLHTIDTWTYVTYDLARVSSLGISNLYASDKPRINKFSSGLYGITPTLFNVTGT